MARRTEPLLEKRREVPTGCRLHHALKIVSGRVLVPVLLEIRVDALPPRRLAELEAKHVQHARGFLIRVAVVQVVGVAVAEPDDWRPLRLSLPPVAAMISDG